MASFMSNFFQNGRDKPAVEASARPTTPHKPNSFVEPASTPQGSPSKKTVPPGANDLSSYFDGMSITSGNTAAGDVPVKLARPQSVVTTPLSPGKTNKGNPLDEASPNVDESVIHQRPASPTKKQHGQENTPPESRPGGTDSPIQRSHAAVTRQQLYESQRPTTPAAKKFNTNRGLTAEEREILQKPGVKRMTNVTQLCERDPCTLFITIANCPRLPRLLL